MITHLLAVEDLNSKIWENLILSSFYFSKNQKPQIQIPDNHDQLSFLFLEPSTRTQLSFSLAASKLNLRVHNIQSEHSSLAKGESLQDTLLNLEAMGINAAIIRLKEENLLRHISRQLTTLRLISAGEGKTSHPSQALLDACTIYEHFKRLDGLKILFLGDNEHSRVYSSNLEWLKWYPNSLYSLSPKTGILQYLNENKSLGTDWEKYLGEFDVIMMLRPQIERHQTPMNLANYLQQFGISTERFKKIKPTTICMHPGPFYQNTEFADGLLKQVNFKILRQVYWGVYARMSIFNFILGS